MPKNEIREVMLRKTNLELVEALEEAWKPKGKEGLSLKQEIIRRLRGGEKL